MKKQYRGSIYIDISAEDPIKAAMVLEDITRHLGQPEEYGLPEDYYNPSPGGVCLFIPGDLIGNSKRAEEI